MKIKNWVYVTLEENIIQAILVDSCGNEFVGILKLEVPEVKEK